MIKLRRITTVLSMFLVLIVLFTGCIQKKTVNYTSKKYRIGFAMPTFNDNFLGKIMNAAKEEAKKLPDTDVVFVNAKNDSTKQASQIANLIAQKCDVIILCAVDSDKATQYIAMAKDSNIPIVSINRVLKDQADVAAYVGSESITAGIMQTEYLAKQLNGKGNVVILKGDESQEAAIKRTEGIKQVLNNYPNIKVVGEASGNWQKTLGMQLTEGWIKNNVKFDAVIANNDEMAIGSIMALKEFNMSDKVLVAGVDATSDALNLVKEGSLKVTVFQNAVGQGQKVMQIAYKLLKGEKVDQNNFVPYELVTKENADEYLKK